MVVLELVNVDTVKNLKGVDRAEAKRRYADWLARERASCKKQVDCLFAKKYRFVNKAKILARRAKYWAENREWLLEHQREYYYSHRERILKSQKEAYHRVR